MVFWFLVQFVEGLLREGIQAGVVPSVVDAQDLAAIRFALVGLGLMLLMIFRPQGILGRREEMMLDAR